MKQPIEERPQDNVILAKRFTQRFGGFSIGSNGLIRFVPGVGRA